MEVDITGFYYYAIILRSTSLEKTLLAAVDVVGWSASSYTTSTSVVDGEATGSVCSTTDDFVGSSPASTKTSTSSASCTIKAVVLARTGFLRTGIVKIEVEVT